MSKLLEVYDNIIPLPLQNHVENVITDQGKGHGMPFVFINGLTDWEIQGDYDFGFSHILTFPQEGIYSNYMHTLHQVFYYFIFYKKLNLHQITASRVFHQPPSLTPGPQKPHIDNNSPHLVFIYYVKDSDGDTIFYKDDKVTEIKRVTPKKGRIAFFDGSIYHTGSRPSKTHRILINLNFLAHPF